MSTANKSRWGFLIPALFIIVAGLFVGMVALLVLPESASAGGPLDQPVLTHEAVGSTTSDDSRVMRELARKPVWYDPVCNCSYHIEEGPSLHYLRAMMIVRGGTLPPLQIRRTPYSAPHPIDPVLIADPGLLRTVIPRPPQPPP